jgi:glucose/arabinose dehydrogenase
MKNRVHSVFCVIYIGLHLDIHAPIAAAAEAGAFSVARRPWVIGKVMRPACDARSRSWICLHRLQIFWQLIWRALPHGRQRPGFRCRHGFKIDLYADGLQDPRFLLTAPNGDIFVVESRENRIKVLRNNKSSAKPDVVETFAEHGLNKPFGIAFYPPGNDPQFLYVANTDGIIRYPYREGDLRARGPAEKLGARLSGGAAHLRSGGHWTRDIVFSPDGKKMYVSIGSRSNVSDSAAEADRARIFEFNPDGTDQKVYAWGIRNAVGIAFRPGTNELWMSTNERDEIGEDLPPDYISSVRPGGFYGWPWFYIGNHADPRHKGKHPELADKGHRS